MLYQIRVLSSEEFCQSVVISIFFVSARQKISTDMIDFKPGVATISVMPENTTSHSQNSQIRIGNGTINVTLKYNNTVIGPIYAKVIQETEN